MGGFAYHVLNRAIGRGTLFQDEADIWRWSEAEKGDIHGCWQICRSRLTGTRRELRGDRKQNNCSQLSKQMQMRNIAAILAWNIPCQLL
jgi:hypothetical protein